MPVVHSAFSSLPTFAPAAQLFPSVLDAAIAPGALEVVMQARVERVGAFPALERRSPPSPVATRSSRSTFASMQSCAARS